MQDTGTPSLALFVRNAAKFIDLATAALQHGTYRLQPARPVEVYVDKPRTIHKLTWPDTFLLGHLARLVSSRIEPLLSDSVYSFRKGRSSALALERVQRFIKNTHLPKYFVRRDVKSFGETMSHDVILQDFETAFPRSETLRELLKTVCKFPVMIDDSLATNSHGLPTGHNIQLVFENLYLRPIDREVREPLAIRLISASVTTCCLYQPTKPALQTPQISWPRLSKKERYGFQIQSPRTKLS